MKKWRRFLSVLLVCFIGLSAVQVHAEKDVSRLEKAEAMGLEKWVDEEGWLLDSFYEDKSDQKLEEMKVHELIHSVTPEELDAYVRRLNAGIAGYVITRYQKIQEGYDITGIFEVNGFLAYCIQHNVVTPPLGSPTSPPVETNNDNLRKVLYYGYNGPASKGYSYVKTAMAASNANGVPSGNTGKRVLTEISALPSPPKKFHVWVVHTNGGKSQDLAYYTLEKNGSLKLQKSSASTELTEGNSSYSLEGAVYGVYSDSACAKQVTVLTTNQKGESNTAELSPGTYYVKEKTAPKGYALSKEVKTIQVIENQTTVFKITDVPQTNPMDILLEKLDAETKEKKSQGSATLKDAEFTVKFYKEEYTGKEKPIRKWVFRTDKDGIVKFTEAYKVSGDTLWKNSDGKPVLPLGTVTIQETKAPDGYLMNPEIFVQKITAKGDGGFVQTYQKVLVEENILKLKLIKRQSNTDIVIPDAVFEHTKPDGTKETLKADEKGELLFKGLQHGVHKIKEISVMDGYVLNENILEFHVSETNKITLQSTIDETLGKVEFHVNEDGNVIVEMEDLLAPVCLTVHKVNDKNLKLAGAEFTLYADKECTEEVKKEITDEKGILQMKDLQIGKKYYLKETRPPKGYKIPADFFGNPIVYEVYTESTPVEDRFQFQINGKIYGTDENEMFFVSGTKAEREIHAVIVNKAGFKLPDTGSVWMFPLIFAGVGLCIWGFHSERRKQV